MYGFDLGCWNRHVMSGVIVFVGDDSSLSVLQGQLLVLLFQSALVKKFLCYPIL